MLDALLAALPDSAYFEQREIGADLRLKLRASEIPFAAYLRGAAAWDLARQPIYPVYSICKTNTEDNADLKVGYGSLVLSSAETGELLVYPMKDESGKMPPAAPAKPARTPSALPRAKTYSTFSWPHGTESRNRPSRPGSPSSIGIGRDQSRNTSSTLHPSSRIPA